MSLRSDGDAEASGPRMLEEALFVYGWRLHDFRKISIPFAVGTLSLFFTSFPHQF